MIRILLTCEEHFYTIIDQKQNIVIKIISQNMTKRHIYIDIKKITKILVLEKIDYVDYGSLFIFSLQM